MLMCERCLRIDRTVDIRAVEYDTLKPGQSAHTFAVTLCAKCWEEWHMLDHTLFRPEIAWKAHVFEVDEDILEEQAPADWLPGDTMKGVKIA